MQLSELPRKGGGILIRDKAVPKPACKTSATFSQTKKEEKNRALRFQRRR